MFDFSVIPIACRLGIQSFTCRFHNLGYKPDFVVGHLYEFVFAFSNNVFGLRSYFHGLNLDCACMSDSVGHIPINTEASRPGQKPEPV